MIVKRLLFAVTALLVALSGQVLAQDATTGNVIFIHPDGSGLNHWNTARMYWEGPDGMLAWDMLPYMAIYRGHMFDRLTGTSNGGATVHAFGYKMEAAGSFGRDGDGDAARIVNNLGGFGGSIMRQAATAGHPVGTVNDGQLAEPGTAVFLTEVGNRNEYNEIVRQILDGRPGNEGEAQPQVVMGGGEIYFLPEGTPLCAGELTLDCAAHYDPDEAENVPSRTDGRNLLQEAAAAGYVVIRTRAEFEALKEQLAADPAYAPKVLGIFGADHVFNDSAEEVLIAAGLVREGVMEGDKLGRIILYGTPEGTAGFNPPTAAEMTEVTLTILERKSAEVG
ncbi:MAG: alkaline phosphatase, partial [Anaerolineae bacterium]|nr:alkaline phosphatase [Anaerolineae bacterium]